jgi:hypothetical protein
MSLFAKEPENERILISEGVHLAVCIGVFDLGTQYNKIFDKEAHQVLIMWEIPDERIKIDEKDLPLAISKKYTLSLHEKAQLRKDLESWRGKAFPAETLKEGFDLKKILGKTCQLQIIHNENNGKTYANIAGIMALPKGTSSLEPENPLKFYSIDQKEIPEDIPDWIKELIKNSKEFQEPEMTNETEDIFEEEGITEIKSKKKEE